MILLRATSICVVAGSVSCFGYLSYPFVII